MRIIAGRLKRRALKAPPGWATRPTTDRTRESLFNLLSARLSFDGIRVLDLFAGTGALGLEALSRGAAQATFVEQDGRVLRVARENAGQLDVVPQTAFVRADAVAFLERYRGAPFPLIFADPPYELPDMPRLPDLALPHLTPGGLFSLEHDRTHDFSEHPALVTARPYGRTVVSIFQRDVEEADG